MSREPALWRKVFEAVEGPVGRWLQDGVHREEFADAMTIARRLQRGVGRRVEGASTTVLHFLNIPARRDVRRVAAQLTRMERALSEVAHIMHEERAPEEIEDADEERSR